MLFIESTQTVCLKLLVVKFSCYFWGVFHTSVIDGISLESEWLQVSRAFLNILADFNNGLSWWFPFVLCFLSLLVPLLSIWELFRAHQLQLVSLSLSCSMTFLVLKQGLSTFLWFSRCSPLGRQSLLFNRFSFYSFFFFIGYH